MSSAGKEVDGDLFYHCRVVGGRLPLDVQRLIGFLAAEVCVFFFNDTATTEIYTLSLHDALPIWSIRARPGWCYAAAGWWNRICPDRKSTRLNSSHLVISYAVFCLKKKNTR